MGRIARNRSHRLWGRMGGKSKRHSLIQFLMTKNLNSSQFRRKKNLQKKNLQKSNLNLYLFWKIKKPSWSPKLKTKILSSKLKKKIFHFQMISHKLKKKMLLPQRSHKLFLNLFLKKKNLSRKKNSKSKSLLIL